MGSDIGIQSPYIEELEEDVLSQGLSPGSNNWSPPRSKSPEPLAQVQETAGLGSEPENTVDQVKVIVEVESQKTNKKRKIGSQQRRRRQYNQLRLLQTTEQRNPTDLRTLITNRLTNQEEPTLITGTFTEQVHSEQQQEQSFYLPYLPPKSPAWEVREALNGRLGLESLHFVSLLVRDRIGSSLRFKKYNFAPPN